MTPANSQEECSANYRLGWVLIGFGVFFWWFFGQYSDLRWVHFLLSEVDGTAGSIISFKESGFELGSDSGTGCPILEVEFSFVDLQGIERRAKSLSHQPAKPIGGKVQVEYIRSNSTIARIKGHNTSPLPPWIHFGWFIPIFGLVKITRAWYSRTFT